MSLNLYETPTLVADRQERIQKDWRPSSSDPSPQTDAKGQIRRSAQPTRRLRQVIGQKLVSLGHLIAGPATISAQR